MPKKTKKKAPGIDEEKEKIRFDYIKSNHFRVIHVDGVYGGNSPRVGHIGMAVWNERWPIPKQTAQMIQSGKVTNEEILSERVMRDAIVREVEVLLTMDIETAKVMQRWLGQKIKQFEKLVKENNLEGGIK